jgi:hypothetical protein
LHPVKNENNLITKLKKKVVAVKLALARRSAIADTPTPASYQ